MGDINKNEIAELSSIISKNLASVTPDFILNTSDVENIDEFKKYLSGKIKILIDNKFDSLINMLYRIDIDDRKIEELFSNKQKDKIPNLLADMIIERQLQKIHFRRLYKEGKI
jgi:hypothetical protein